jgi:hypothetical protein
MVIVQRLLSSTVNNLCDLGALRLALDAALTPLVAQGLWVENEETIFMEFPQDLTPAQETVVTNVVSAQTGAPPVQVFQRLAGNLDSSSKPVTSVTLDFFAGGLMYPPGVAGVLNYTKLWLRIYGLYKIVWILGVKPSVQITEMGTLNGGIDRDLITITPELGNTTGWQLLVVTTDKIIGTQGLCEYQLRAGKGEAVLFQLKSLTYILWENV